MKNVVFAWHFYDIFVAHKVQPIFPALIWVNSTNPCLHCFSPFPVKCAYPHRGNSAYIAKASKKIRPKIFKA